MVSSGLVVSWRPRERGSRDGCRTAGEDEERVRELDDGEAAQVLGVDDVGEDAQRAGAEREAVDCAEEDLHCDHGVDQAGEEFLREDGVLLDQFGEVVEAGCCVPEVSNETAGGVRMERAHQSPR